MLQSRGISDLLAAEKKAQDLIEEARKRKNKRLKDAQNEAKTEIEQFKGERDQRYKGLEQQVNSKLYFSYIFIFISNSNWVIEHK
jgi:V-type H+-transporting ATPase subunit G